MASVSVVRAGGAGTGGLLFACVAGQGSAAHPYFASPALAAGPESARNLADAVHFLCALHGRHPGVVDLAAGRTIEAEARAWLIAAGDSMAEERRFLTRLSVAAGSAPSTPGGAMSETAVIAQRAALATLAQSDRRGCALGAALAFAIDWNRIRTLLDSAARRLGVEAPPCRLGDEATLRAIADSAGATAVTERALLFGAEQLALQHRGLWDLLEARRQARLEG
jgi:uncharacterized protein DUF6975